MGYTREALAEVMKKAEERGKACSVQMLIGGLVKEEMKLQFRLISLKTFPVHTLFGYHVEIRENCRICFHSADQDFLSCLLMCNLFEYQALNFKESIVTTQKYLFGRQFTR